MCKDRSDRANCSMLGLCVVLRYRFVFTIPPTSHFQCNLEHALATRCLVHDLFHPWHSHIHHLDSPILYPSPSPLRLPDPASGLLDSATEDCQLSASDCSTYGECQWFLHMKGQTRRCLYEVILEQNLPLLIYYLMVYMVPTPYSLVLLPEYLVCSFVLAWPITFPTAL